MAMMSVAEGAAMITETIFENRFMHVPELSRMGANVNVHGASVMVRGVDRRYEAEVMATGSARVFVAGTRGSCSQRGNGHSACVSPRPRL